jgi:hypothetical protein
MSLSKAVLFFSKSPSLCAMQGDDKDDPTSAIRVLLLSVIENDIVEKWGDPQFYDIRTGHYEKKEMFKNI